MATAELTPGVSTQSTVSSQSTSTQSSSIQSSTSPATLVPTPGLVVSNPSPQGGQPLFCLFTEDWITLQTFIVQALQLPITVGDFEAKYGTFTDEQQIENCVAAMQNVQKLTSDFGDPTALVKQLASDPTILQSSTAPTQLYTHIVWFATQLYQAATTFDQTLGQFMTVLNSTPADQRQQVVTEILTGPGGLQSTALNMKQLANDLSSAMATFNTNLTPAVTEFSNYSGQSTQFYNDVLAAIKADDSDVTTFQNEANAAYTLWRDLTISAVTVSIGLMILTAGLAWPLAATAAGVLGSQAQKARDAYNAAVQQVQAAQADDQKKIQLKMDLNTFNIQMGPVNNAAQNFANTLSKVEGVWLNIANNIAYIATHFTPDQLQDLAVFQQAMQLDDATQDWKTIAKKADEYTANSLVSYQIQNFGATLPPNPSNN